MKTKERLAQVLHQEGLFDHEAKARAGHYDDFESESATPIMDLVEQLRAYGREDLAKRAINGEWDGTKEDAEGWWEREGKDLL